MEAKRDIFISYKNDGEGRHFAKILCADLENFGYSVYYNANEQHSGSFPKRLRDAVGNCKDFLLIVTQTCLEQLIRHDKVDWVREELLTAYNTDKNIIPLLMPGVSMPRDKDVMPEDLRFLPDKNAITMSDPYDRSPLDFLLSWIKAKADSKDILKDIYNSNNERNIDNDFEKALREAENHNYKYMYELANYYYYGLVNGCDGECCRDYYKAYQLLKILSESESEYTEYATSMIAEMYFHGVVPREPQSYSKSLQYHAKAKGKSGFSAREYAYLKSRGCGVSFNYNEIENDYLTAIDQGDNIAVIGLARFYMDFGQFEKAAELFKRTSHIVPDAEYRLGMMYRNGLLSDPPKPDFFRAAFYFQHAIDSGKCNADVYHQLGRLYFTPTDDFPRDFRVAEKYFLMASERGNNDANYKLGLIYEYGYTEKNLEKAIHYHSLAASQGISFSAYHLALLYQEPEFKNYHKACDNARIAANKGVMEAEYLYGVFLFYGRGCIADEQKAYEYLSKAYDHGMFQAKILMDRIEETSLC